MKRDKDNRFSGIPCINRKLIFQLAPLTRLGTIHDVSPSADVSQIMNKRSRSIPRQKLFSDTGTTWHSTSISPALLLLFAVTAIRDVVCPVKYMYRFSVQDFSRLLSTTSAVLYHRRRWRPCPSLTIFTHSFVATMQSTIR